MPYWRQTITLAAYEDVAIAIVSSSSLHISHVYCHKTNNIVQGNIEMI